MQRPRLHPIVPARPTWTTTLDRGDTAAAERILEYLRRALAVVECVPPSMSATTADPLAPPDVGLPAGAAGLALFYASLAHAQRDASGRDRAAHYLAIATDAMREHPLPMHLHGGIAGIGWVHAHIARTMPQLELVELAALRPIDDALLALLACPEWGDEYDLTGGLVGFGVYGLERGDEAGASIVRRVVHHLHVRATIDERGARWETRGEELPPWQRELAPEGYVNLGLAHGVPGVIALLSSVALRGLDEPADRMLLDGAVRWLLAQASEDVRTSVFPTWVPHGRGDVLPARAAWCYGDPGVALALAAAARATGTTRWRDAAVALGDAIAGREVAACRVYDASMCHGAIGLAHALARLAHATGERRFIEAAQPWYRAAIAAHQPARALGGFPFATLDGRGERRWRDDPGVLMGAAGVGLGLLAAMGVCEPRWDCCLLMS